MKKLDEAEIIRTMREVWNSKVASLGEAVDAVLKGKVEGDMKTLIAPDLKLRHKESQLLYTVVSVGPRDVVLRTPEGKKFLVDAAELEKDYELD